MESASKKHDKTNSMEGWITLNRKLLDWEWHDDPAMFSLWIHLLLLANYEDKKWHGIVIKRGQLVTSLANLHEQTGLSVRQIRTCLARLRDCEQIASKSTNKYTVITICNYDSYQDKPINERQAERQTNDNQATTTEQSNNIYIDVVDINAHAYTHEGLVVGILEKTASLNTFCMQNRISVDDFTALAHEVINDWNLQGTTHINERDACRHLFNTIRIKLNERKRNGNTDRKTHSEQVSDLYAGVAARIARRAAEDDARNSKVRNS